MDALDRALGALHDGQAVGNMLEILDPALSQLDNAVDKRIYSKLMAGQEVTPEEAKQAWMEKFSYHRLLKRLTRKVSAGKRASQILQEDLNG